MTALNDIVPFRAPRRRSDTNSFVGMLIFLGTWAMMFGALFFAYAEVRLKNAEWPPSGEAPLPIALPLLNTIVLMLASVALGFALKAVRTAHPGGLRLGLFGALVFGSLFLALQMVVWRSIYLGGLKPSTDIYGSVFYGLTCFHALHVLVGLGGIISLLPGALSGKFNVQRHASVRHWVMYWHFVDVVWVLMFVTVYVL